MKRLSIFFGLFFSLFITAQQPIISSSSDHPPNEADDKAFDLNNNTKWFAYAISGYLQIEFETAIVFNRYNIVSANDEAPRDPKNWKVQGSNNGSTWFDLDTQTSQVFVNRYELHSYNLSNNTAYKFYKLNISANNGSLQYLQLADFTLIEAPTAPILSTTYKTDTTVDLGWTASTDNNGIAGYKVYKNGILDITLGNVLSYQATGLTSETAYNFTVTAIDAQNNESILSNVATITTNASSGGGDGYWSLNNQSVYYTNGNVGIGTSIPDSKLTVKGSIHSEEVKVDLSVPAPDYVFEADYNLFSLEKLQEYITNHGHLPNIPSAKDMELNGLELGIMSMKLLEKIEELTLYLLEQEKQLNLQNEELIHLLTRIAKKE